MKENGVIVRQAEQPDLDFVSQDGYLPGEVVSRKIEQGEVFLVCVENTPVGYLRLGFLWGEIPLIELIKVEKANRKRGYSRQLLAFVEKHLRGEGYQVLYSSSQVNETEPQAWHRHMGFTECGIINGLNEGDVGEVFFRKLL